jgi:uncharacterized protein
MSDLSEVKIPDLEDPLYAPFWEGAAQGKIRVQCCGDCGTRRWPPRFMCWNCQSLATDWVDEKLEGRLYTWTVVGQPTTKAYMDVPYVVGIVALEDDPPLRIVGHVTNIDISTLAVGQKLKPRFVKAGPTGEITLIHWEPEQQADNCGTPSLR